MPTREAARPWARRSAKRSNLVQRGEDRLGAARLGPEGDDALRAEALEVGDDPEEEGDDPDLFTGVVDYFPACLERVTDRECADREARRHTARHRSLLQSSQSVWESLNKLCGLF